MMIRLLLSDINECLKNNGNGPCEDECENNVGSYRCRCNRPGYIVDEDDPHACFRKIDQRSLNHISLVSFLVGYWYPIFWSRVGSSCDVKITLGFTAIVDVFRSFIPNKTTFAKYYLTQWISNLSGSFEIHWVSQYLVNFTGLESKLDCLQNRANFHRSRAWQIAINSFVIIM